MKILAWVLDLLIVIVGFGYIFTQLSGGSSTGQQVSVNGVWFLMWIAAVVLYFILTKKYLGQTLGNKIVGLKKTSKK